MLQLTLQLGPKVRQATPSSMNLIYILSNKTIYNSSTGQYQKHSNDQGYRHREDWRNLRF